MFSQQSRPVITFAEKEFDFGAFRESEGVVNHDFTFTNTGKVPLIIQDVKASCGCTTPQWTKEPVLPGETGTIRVSFNPKSRPGSFNKTIQVKSNADITSVTLAVKGVVIPVDNLETTYKYTAGQIRLQTIYAAFGEVYKGKTAEFTIKVMNTSPDKSATLSFKQLPQHLRAAMVPEVIEPRQEGSIELEYLSGMQKDWDYVVDRIDLLVNGQPASGNRISVTANIKENFADLTADDLSKAPVVDFDQITFNFGTIPSSQVVDHVFTITNRGTSDLIIRKVSASCGCTAVRPVKDLVSPGESTAIKVSFNAAGREGSQKKAITVITNDPKRSRTILWINGIVTKSEVGSSQP
jgi:hypothetical protein